MHPAPNTTTRVPSEHDENKPLRDNAVNAGIAGDIISIIFVFIAGIGLHCRQCVAMRIIKEIQLDNPEKDINLCLMVKVVVIVSGSVYALSLINILVCTMLIIGANRRCSSLMFPWLLFYGLLYCVGVHIMIYAIAFGYYNQFAPMLIIVSVSVLASFLFFKVYFKVLELYKIQQNETQEHITAAAQAEQAGELDISNIKVPYQSFA